MILPNRFQCVNQGICEGVERQNKDGHPAGKKINIYSVTPKPGKEVIFNIDNS